MKYNKQQGIETCDDEQCIICQENFVFDEKVKYLTCFHKFHSDCIDFWLEKGKGWCPFCKEPLDL